jgi:serine/threonine-protein kinase
LGAYLRREEMMPIETALALLGRIASALVAAHEAGVVHRDLKPDNIFLIGAPPTDVKLLDFGLAKVGHHSLVSRSGVAVGTMAYMAPEQVLAEPVDGRTDVYGLGVVLFRTLTGHLPFEGSEEIDVLAHQLLSPAPPPSWLREALTPEVDAVIGAALRKHPANRYASMAAMLADLERLAGLRGGDVEIPRIAREPDRYDPTTEDARSAASIFYARAGQTPPEW